MKVMLILASSGPTIGGMELQAAQQAEELSKIPNTEVSIIAADCFDLLFPNSVHHYPAKMTRSRRNVLLLASLLKAINAFSPDIIHAHGHKAASLLSSLKPFIRKNIKLVATAHNVKRNNKQLIKMDEVFVVSKGIAKAVSPLKSHVVLNGIKPHQAGKLSKESFCQSMGLDPSLPLILGVGRLVQTKRFEYLLNAAKGLNANIVICGDGPEYNDLEQLTSHNCVLAGHRKDIRDLLFVADFMVISADRDGFSLALIEALHSGLPVLSTAVPGAEDLLPEECLIRNIETRAFHEFLQNHLKNLGQLRKIQQPLFEFVRNELHISQVAGRTHSLYKSLLDKSTTA
tara:strand:- start:2400 stop:3431 length:1032 start_codon:yes stop_codon:yes gene_type:complete